MSAPAGNRGDGGGRMEKQGHDSTGEFLHDKHGRPFLDAFALDVLRAWRYFRTMGAGKLLAALLVIAWAAGRRGAP